MPPRDIVQSPHPSNACLLPLLPSSRRAASSPARRSLGVGRRGRRLGPPARDSGAFGSCTSALRVLRPPSAAGLGRLSLRSFGTGGPCVLWRLRGLVALCALQIGAVRRMNSQVTSRAAGAGADIVPTIAPVEPPSSWPQRQRSTSARRAAAHSPIAPCARASVRGGSDGGGVPNAHGSKAVSLVTQTVCGTCAAAGAVRDADAAKPPLSAAPSSFWPERKADDTTTSGVVDRAISQRTGSSSCARVVALRPFGSAAPNAIGASAAPAVAVASDGRVNRRRKRRSARRASGWTVCHTGVACLCVECELDHIDNSARPLANDIERGRRWLRWLPRDRCCCEREPERHVTCAHCADLRADPVT